MNKKASQMVTGIMIYSTILAACGNETVTPASMENTETAAAQTQNETNPAIENNEAQSSKTINLDVDGENYIVAVKDESAKKFTFAAKTSKGMVWIPAPAMEQRPGTESYPEYYPIEPFTIYLNHAKDHTLDINTPTKLLTLPLKDGEAEVVVDNLFAVNDTILYHIISDFRDAAQPLRQQLWAMNVNDPSSNKAIAEFHTSGGRFYDYTIDKTEGLYVGVYTTPGNPDGSYTYEAFVYNTKTGQQEMLKNFEFHSEEPVTIQFTYEGKKRSYELTYK
jgi:hypothetical protein